VIRVPGDKAFEYGAHSIVPYAMCGYGCLYCYVVAIWAKQYANRFPHLDWDECLIAADYEFRSGARPVEGFMDDYLHDLKLVDERGIDLITTNFMGDVYPKRPIDSSQTREIIIETHERTNAGIMIITKSGRLSLRDLDLFDPERDVHMFTLCSLDEKYTRKWERDTAMPAERIWAAKRIKAKGGRVVQSCEPVMNVKEAFAAMAECYPWVDQINLGPTSFIGHQEMKRLPLDKRWRQQTDEEHAWLVSQALMQFGDKIKVKEGLQKFVPDALKEITSQMRIKRR